MDFNSTWSDIFRFIGQLVVWAIAIILGVTVLITLASGMIAFASTGIGAIILAIVAWRLWVKYSSEE